MPLRYQYLQLVLEQEARAALEAQRAARYRQWVADRCAAKEHALLLEALSGMRYSDASAWDMIAQLKQRWNSPPPEQAEPVAVESIRLDSKLPMLKELAVGAVTKLVEKDGAAAEEFVVIAQDYEKELNGEGRTFLARRHGITGKKWNTIWCTYADSLIDVYLNSEYLKDAPQALKDILTETKFYYTPGYSGSGSSYTGSNTVTTLSRKVFLPSCYEFGFESYGYTSASSPKYYHLEGSTFADAKKLALALLAADAETAGSVPNTYFHFCLWTRTPVLNDYGSGLTGSALKEYLYKCAEAVWAQMLTAPDKLNWGGYKVNEPENTSWPDLYRCWTHPCFTLPGNTVIDAKGNIVEVREE